MLYFLGRFSWIPIVVLPILTCLKTSYALVEKSLGRIDVQATIEGVYDSNMFSSYTEESDFLVKFIPIAQYAKRLGPLQVSAALGGSFGRYFDHGEEDFSDPITRFSFGMAEDFGIFSVDKRSAGKVQFGFDTDISQRTETNEQLQDLISYTLYSADFSVRYNHSPKFGVSTNINYGFRDYKNFSGREESYQNIEDVNAGITAYYIYSPKLDFYLGHTFSIIDSPEPSNFIKGSVNHTMFGIDGDITPKLTGNVQLGYATRSYDNSDLAAEDSMLFDVQLMWAWREKTKLSLNFMREFDPSPQDQGMLTTTFGTQVTQRFSKRVAGTLGAYYGTVDFSSYREFGPFFERSDRTDKRYGISLTVLAHLTSYLDGRFGYNYTNITSGLGDEFNNERHLLSIGLIVQY